jgi:hypothetical protein
MTPDQLDLLFRETFPMKATHERTSLEYVELTEHAGAPAVVLRLICWDVLTRVHEDAARAAPHGPVEAGDRTYRGGLREGAEREVAARSLAARVVSQRGT